MSETPQTQSTEEGLGLWDAVSIIVGIVVGASIFHVPWLIFANVSDPYMGLAVWIFGGLLAVVGALCYAELATTYPRSGGDYEYLTRAYGSPVGFLFGWAQLAIVLPASIGVMAYVFSDNMVELLGVTGNSSHGVPYSLLFAAAAVVVLTIFNVIGVTFGKTTQNFLTASKVLGLGMILIAGLCWGQPANFGPLPNLSNLQWGSLAIILVLYAYGGWNDAAFVAAEVRNRKRNLPLALILGTGIITAIYIAVNMAYLLGLGFDDVSKPGLVPAKVMARTPLGDTGAAVIGVLIMISALGAANGLIFTGSRVYAAVGSDHRLFGFLGRWKPGHGAPVVSLLVQGMITLWLIAIFGTRSGHTFINDMLGIIGLEPNSDWKPGSAFDTLISHTAPVFWFFFLLTGVSLFVLRLRNPRRERPFSVPLFPFLPLAFCGMCIYMLYASTKFVGARALFAVGLLALGFPLYWLSRSMGRPYPRQELETTESISPESR